MRRRDFITLTALGAIQPFLGAGAAGAIPVIGFLYPGFRSTTSGPATFTRLTDRLRELGYIDTETATIAARFAEGKVERLTGAAQELVRLKVDVLVAVARTSIEAARTATKEIPIVVMDLESDPVASGFAASWTMPGGNLTGLFLDVPDLAGKWLQLMRELVPHARRVAVVWDPSTGDAQLRALAVAGKAIAVEFQVLELRDVATLDTVLDAGLAERPDALIQLGSPLLNQLDGRIAAFAAAHRVPAISPFRTFAERGAVMSYGPVLTQWYRRLAEIVAAVLKGTKPGILPLEQPPNFELVVNRKAAVAMGLTIPEALLLRADEVIE